MTGQQPAPRADVVVAYVHSHEVAYSWHSSYLELFLWDMAHDRRLSHRVGVKCASGNLVEARNQCAASFLSGPGEWLFIIDTDMGFAPDTLDRLLEAADQELRPIVGALCFAWLEHEPDGLGGYRCGPRPTIFQFTPGDTETTPVFAAVDEYPENTLVPVAATGSACIVIHRSVLERIHAENGPHWYDRITVGDRVLSEDISLCARAGALGIGVHVHTGVPTNHQKTTWVGPADHPPIVEAQPVVEVETFPRQNGKSQPPVEGEGDPFGVLGNRAARRARGRK